VHPAPAGSSAFTVRSRLPSADIPLSVLAADVTGDGRRPDLLAGTFNRVTIWAGTDGH
jgi:hypothetical protein